MSGQWRAGPPQHLPRIGVALESLELLWLQAERVVHPLRHPEQPRIRTPSRAVVIAHGSLPLPLGVGSPPRSHHPPGGAPPSRRWWSSQTAAPTAFDTARLSPRPQNSGGGSRCARWRPAPSLGRRRFSEWKKNEPDPPVICCVRILTVRPYYGSSRAVEPY